MAPIHFALRASLVASLALAGGFAWAETIFRCGSAYSTTPCVGGRAIAQAPAVPQGARMETIYLCKSYAGQGFWTNRHCNHRNPPATLERMVSVPADLPWDEKVEIAAGTRREAEAVRRNQLAQPALTNSPGPAFDRCAQFRQALAANDSAARAGGRAAWMERLAEERRSILASMSAARCRG